jgi:hypothetical protein
MWLSSAPAQLKGGSRKGARYHQYQSLSALVLISFGFNSSPLAAYNIRMSEYIHKRYNVTVLLYHLVFPAKYRRAAVDGNVDETIRDVCLKIVTS